MNLPLISDYRNSITLNAEGQPAEEERKDKKIGRDRSNKILIIIKISRIKNQESRIKNQESRIKNIYTIYLLF